MKMLWTLLSFLLLGLAGCGEHSKPNFVYMPDMVYSPAYKAQKEGSMRNPVPGTIPVDFVPYAYRFDPDAAGVEMKNPIKATRAVLARGQVQYNIYCSVCHGTGGLGDGSVVPKFPQPPSLMSDKIRGWTDGRIHHNIVAGQGLMGSYASQIVPADRWAIVHYIRALQKASQPTEADLNHAAKAQ